MPSGVPWPNDAWITRSQFEVIVPEQVVRRSLSAPPVSPRPPRWRIVTTVAPWLTADLRRFLNSLGGAQQIVALPAGGRLDDTGNLISSMETVQKLVATKDGARVVIDDGDLDGGQLVRVAGSAVVSASQSEMVNVPTGNWTVTNFRLGGRYLEVTVTSRPGVDPPREGSLLLLGDGSSMRLYEMGEYTSPGATTWYLNPRRLPVQGANVMRASDTVDVRRVPNPFGSDAGVAENEVHQGATVEWVEAW
ncbi:MAG: hypothetical protein OXH70_17775 [Acidobacteria bacterium]|nr:hypothetical protein [Acidobacteriota bacterium]